MGTFAKLTENITEVAVMVMLIIAFGLSLAKFKTTAIMCPSLYTLNSSANNCFLTTNSSQPTLSAPLAGSIDKAIIAIQTPIDFVEIVIIVLIVASLVVLLTTVLKNRGSKD